MVMAYVTHNYDFIFKYIDVVNCIVIFNARFLKTVFFKCLRLITSQPLFRIAQTFQEMLTTVLFIGCIKFLLTETIFFYLRPKFRQKRAIH